MSSGLRLFVRTSGPLPGPDTKIVLEGIDITRAVHSFRLDMSAGERIYASFEVFVDDIDIVTEVDEDSEGYAIDRGIGVEKHEPKRLRDVVEDFQRRLGSKT